jgi:purine-nucleoside phosphorylase
VEDAIVQPPARRGDKPPIPPWVVMVATGPDLQRLRQRMSLSDDRGEGLYLSRIYRPAADGLPYGLVGPFMGAPQAAMLMETLSAWGGAHFLFIGWCGAIDPQLRTGDILLPTSAFIDEGTSRGYGIGDDQVGLPSDGLLDVVRNGLKDNHLPFKEGAVWTTDAVFRETPSKVKRFRQQGALAVEMELSACMTVARLRQVRLAAILVVSDDLSDLTWRPGFRDPRFKQACKAVSQTVTTLCQTF